jgi:hypothetical protein
VGHAAPPGSSRESTPAIGLVAFLVVVYGGLLVVLWQIGIFDLDGETNAQVLAPVLALVGAAFGASLTLVGVLLKHSIDARTEARLRVETCMRAVELLATGDGKVAPPTQQAGALFALIRLRHVGLAVSLLSEIWPRGEISSNAATWVINAALESGEQAIERDAASVLSENAERLLGPNGTLVLPHAIEHKWPHWSGLHTREALLYALVRALAAREPADWPPTLKNGLVVQFDLISTVDTAEHMRATALLPLQLILHSAEYAGRSRDLLLADRRLDSGLLSIRVDARVTAEYGQATRDVSDIIEKLWPVWVGDGTPSPRTAWEASQAES